MKRLLVVLVSIAAVACGDDGGSGSDTESPSSGSEDSGAATQGMGTTATGSTAEGSGTGSDSLLLTTGADTTAATGDTGDTGGPPTDQVPCDVLAVTCDAAPPACDGLRVPEIVRGCYTQACIPLSSCEEVVRASCDECDAGEVCVRFSACEGDACTFAMACLPDPGAAVVNCATSGRVLCGAFGPGFSCHDEDTGPYCCRGDARVCGSAG